ncbi:non-lysosomal glucosylceramidase-like isoform X2 [Babylonia areolata]|uniref:non-lysosomal glucosylceramidase-like isoform X2 n=1 Tax=Babylonia areolata TaxID=304850 RepID=UPI003FCF8E8E
MACVSPSESSTTPRERIAGLPDFGWRVPLSYSCDLKCHAFFQPRLNQIPQYIGLSFRYMHFWINKRRQGRQPYIDQLNQMGHKPIYGCPIGGIGCGTIGRGYRGEFCRFQMSPGLYHYKEVEANQFILTLRRNGETVYQQVLSSHKKKGKALKSWKWGFPGEQATYHALYPRAWTVYRIPEHSVTVTCRQISPIFPHDYKDTSLPTAAFVWEIRNDGDSDLDASITFTFKNGQGVKADSAGGCWAEPFQHPLDSTGSSGSTTTGSLAKGVSINQTISGQSCSYNVAATDKPGVKVTYHTAFDPNGSGHNVWNNLYTNGHLGSSTEATPKASKGQEVATAVCASTTVKCGSSGHLDFCLAWDMPVVQFKAAENKYSRRYARWFGTAGDAGPRLCAYALAHFPLWEQKIEDWQNPVLQNKNLPAWYKSALFNELYFVSDGGTVWLDPMEGNSQVSTHPVVQEYSKFAYLEGHEYRMYNTYDVHHYSSFALIMLWPKLQISLQYDFADTIHTEDGQQTKYLMHGDVGVRKAANTVPHDLGDPEDEPWKRVNAYVTLPTYDWKDLNLKFVLQTYRDFSATRDKPYLEFLYPCCKTVIEKAISWDKNGDGLIENSGFADQTFDAWVMTGSSAYCAGMWLAALRMQVEMADILGQTEDKERYSAILQRGKKSFEEKLWNGRYFDFDTSQSGHHDSIMADQLAGHWFLKASDLDDGTVFDPDHVITSLKTIYENNVMKYGKGNMGAINGTRPDGKKDLSSPQSEEFWTGVTYALAANMIQNGMVEEGFQTAWGAYHVCWEWLGLHFQTPEAYTTDHCYRSLGYMRPLAVWAIQWALEKFQPHLVAAGGGGGARHIGCGESQPL